MKKALYEGILAVVFNLRADRVRYRGKVPGLADEVTALSRRYGRINSFQKTSSGCYLGLQANNSQRLEERCG